MRINMLPCVFADLNNIPYQIALQKQEELQSLRIKNLIPNQLLFCEHNHVLTMGLSGRENNLLISKETLQQMGIEYYQTKRGGDITYHGPGQITGYPIFHLNEMGLGVKEYVHRLEQCVIETLKLFNIESGRLSGATGVWIDSNTPKARKICAIGIKVSRGVTMHGFAFNVNTNLSFYQYMNPCGFIDKGVTSMEKELTAKQDFSQVKQILKNQFSEVFGCQFQ